MIRHAKLEDLPQLLNLYKHARQYMRSQGNHSQWTQDYPSESILIEDINLKRLYVYEVDDEILGAMMFEIGIDETYLEIDGAWINDEPYGVIHRIATSSNRKGIASLMLEWALSQIDNIKIDTHQDNKPMLSWLSKHNFKSCGTIKLKNGEPRLAFQKQRGKK